MNEETTMKIRDFKKMTPEENLVYASVWNEHQEDVMLTVVAAFQERFKISRHDIDFHKDLREITNSDEELTAHAFFDVHEIHDVPLTYSGHTPYSIYSSLYDLVLQISAAITDKQLGYISPENA